jgi:hypothetical protein
MPYVFRTTDCHSLRTYKETRHGRIDFGQRKGFFTMSTKPMQVILGVSSLKAYVTAPKAFHLLGIVRFGLEYGLLATNTEGLYFRVNGSQIVALDTDTVRRAIDYAYGNHRHHTGSGENANRAPVPVVVRKHRHAAAEVPH